MDEPITRFPNREVLMWANDTKFASLVNKPLISHTSNPEHKPLVNHSLMEALRDRTEKVIIALKEEEVMTLKELLDKRSEHYDAIQELDKQIKVLAVEDLKTKFKGIFAQYPTCKQFSWTQFTDYFNDGDPCYFHAHCDPDCIHVSCNNPQDEEAVQDAVSEILADWDDDDLEEFFGDHKKIVVTKDELVVESYTNHD